MKKKIHHTTTHPKPRKMGLNNWQIAAFVLVFLLILSVFTNGFSFKKKLSKEEIKDQTEAYLNKLMMGQATVVVKEVTEEEGLYRVKLDVGGRVYDSYATKDGKLLFPQAMNMTANLSAQPVEQPEADNIPKSDKPKVELFVMSYCPFGTQAEKGIIPAVKALGSNVDFKVRFVYYSMHGEKEVRENLNQYCIQKEQPAKYLPYLECFLKAGDAESCLSEAGVDTAKMESCTEAADAEFAITENLEDQSKWLNGRYPLFNTNAELNQQYGVGGSPTLVINGVKSSAGRDSASYLSGICSSFNTQPAACAAELSSTAPSTGFGYENTGAASSGGCGA